MHKFVEDAGLASLAGSGLHEGMGLKALCQRLVETAQLNGSYDDISALLEQRRPWFGAASGYWLALLVGLWVLGMVLSL